MMKGTIMMSKNIADISTFENLQSQAHKAMGLGSSMSVFNSAKTKTDVENDEDENKVTNTEEELSQKVANAVSELVEEKVKNADADKDDTAVKNAEEELAQKVANAVSELVDEKVKNAETEKEQPVDNNVFSDASARKDDLKSRH
jgi:ribosomal protein L29